MNKINTLEDKFDFEDIELEHPNSLQGGSYFTRINMHSSPVYIQTSPCSTKSGIVNTAKKSYCDLMFNSHEDKTLQWFENLEKICIDKIFQKKDMWFHNEMELDDIETAFTSPIRLYKSGKKYLIRCNIASNSLSSGTFKCYDEHTNPVSLDKLENPAVKIIPLLEVQGIRFTSKTFTLELALKQIMIIENPDFMNECFIQPEHIKSIRQNNPDKEINDEEINNEEINATESIESSENINSENKKEKEDSLQEMDSENILEDTQLIDHKEEDTEKNLEEDIQEGIQEGIQEELKQLELGNEEQPIPEKKEEISEETIKTNTPTLLDEVKLNYNNLGDEAVKLKSHEEVYYDLWYEARSRAKLAREEAIKAYLEAKNIKNIYMLDNLSDSDDELEEYLNE